VALASRFMPPGVRVASRRRPSASRRGRVVLVAAVVDQADLAVEPFELGVGAAELDGGEDALRADRPDAVVDKSICPPNARAVRSRSPRLPLRLPSPSAWVVALFPM
jgi:hypothetical protein